MIGLMAKSFDEHLSRSRDFLSVDGSWADSDNSTPRYGSSSPRCEEVPVSRSLTTGGVSFYLNM